MSEQNKKKSLNDAEMVTARGMGRRSSIAILGASILGAAGMVALAPSEAHAIPGCTDRDPGDPASQGRGRGISDSDPRDPAGCGSRNCSDSDPNDPAGRGRHC